MSDARIGDAGLPGHFEFAEVGQVAQNFETAIGKLAAGELAQIQVFQLRHAGEVQQAVVREFARPAEAEGGDVIQCSDVGQRGVRHQSVAHPLRECGARALCRSTHPTPPVVMRRLGPMRFSLESIT